MATLHKELWRYRDNRGATATVFRTSESQGRLLVIGAADSPVNIHTAPEDRRVLLDRVVALGPHAPTSDDDREWFEAADRVIGNLIEDQTS